MNEQQFLALVRERDAACFYANQSTNPEELHRAIKRVSEMEQQIDAAPFEFGDDGKVISTLRPSHHPKCQKLE